jgi:hypothetical protein
MRRKVPVLTEAGEIIEAEIADEVVRLSEQLPYAPDRYFVIDDETVVLPTSRLLNSRIREKGVEHAVELMRLAHQGMQARRAPVTVTVCRDGRFLVLDGNSTVVIAKAAGWDDIPCRVLAEGGLYEQTERAG